MSDSAHDVDVAPSPSVIRIYSVVLGVGVVCALAIAMIYEVTRPIIWQNRTELRQRAVLDLLPGATSSTTFRFDQESGQFVKMTADAGSRDSVFAIFAGYDDAGQLVGLAIETAGMGYQDLIRLLYGYSFDAEAVIGISVLDSRETPGLGNRIEQDADFLSNFEKLDVRLNRDQSAVANRIEFVKPGQKRAPWQIDGITGATISSRAVADMLADSTADWIPRVYSRRDEFAMPKRETR